jgi:CheY-specific phosphatase CheX
MLVSNGFINEVVAEVWDSMLGVSIEAVAEGDAPEDGDVDQEGISGLIQISGRWNGSVVLACARALAIELTQAMFAMEDEEPGPEEIRDAFGELTNMVGGRLKNEVGEPSQLSLPQVIEGEGYEEHLTPGRCMRNLSFDCLGKSLQVKIFETREPKER